MTVNVSLDFLAFTTYGRINHADEGFRIKDEDLLFLSADAVMNNDDEDDWIHGKRGYDG
jgi:hypothetical protein